MIICWVHKVDLKGKLCLHFCGIPRCSSRNVILSLNNKRENVSKLFDNLLMFREPGFGVVEWYNMKVRLPTLGREVPSLSLTFINLIFNCLSSTLQYLVRYKKLFAVCLNIHHEQIDWNHSMANYEIIRTVKHCLTMFMFVRKNIIKLLLTIWRNLVRHQPFEGKSKLHSFKLRPAVCQPSDLLY